MILYRKVKMQNVYLIIESESKGKRCNLNHPIACFFPSRDRDYEKNTIHELKFSKQNNSKYQLTY